MSMTAMRLAMRVQLPPRPLPWVRPRMAASSSVQPASASSQAKRHASRLTTLRPSSYRSSMTSASRPSFSNDSYMRYSRSAAYASSIESCPSNALVPDWMSCLSRNQLRKRSESLRGWLAL